MRSRVLLGVALLVFISTALTALSRPTVAQDDFGCPPGQPAAARPGPTFVPTQDCVGWVPANHPLARSSSSSGFDAVIQNNRDQQFVDGRQIFRFDTFGDEAFWGDQL